MTALAQTPALASTNGRRGVPATVTLRQTELADLRDEAHALRAESLAFAERVRKRIDRVKNLVATGQDMAAINEAGKIGYDADRRLEQLGSVAAP